jgi:hypothetical protein
MAETVFVLYYEKLVQFCENCSKHRDIRRLDDHSLISVPGEKAQRLCLQNMSRG